MGKKLVAVRVHLVWSTKYRERLLTPECRRRLIPYVETLVKSRGGKLLCGGAWYDHVHFYVALDTQLSIGVLVNIIKSKTSSWVRRTMPGFERFRWQRGYAAFSANPRDDHRLQSYIRNQERIHAHREYEREYARLLTRYGFTPDDDIWD